MSIYASARGVASRSPNETRGVAFIEIVLRRPEPVRHGHVTHGHARTLQLGDDTFQLIHALLGESKVLWPNERQVVRPEIAKTDVPQARRTSTMRRTRQARDRGRLSVDGVRLLSGERVPRKACPARGAGRNAARLCDDKRSMTNRNPESNSPARERGQSSR